MKAALSLPFAMDVAVAAETVRVVGFSQEGRRHFRQSHRMRDSGHFVQHEFGEGWTWPGVGIPLEWDAGPGAGYELDPEPDERIYVRLRRLLFDRPEPGVVIGQTRRTEGTLVGGKDSETDLVGPGRKTYLFEVAMPPLAGGFRSRIVMVHPNDLTALGLPLARAG